MNCKRQGMCSALRRALAHGVLLVALLPLAAAAQPLATFANGETISADEFASWVDRRLDLRGLARNYWGVEMALREMALTRTLVLEGEALGKEKDKREHDPANRFDDIYGFKVYGDLAPRCEKPASESAARAYYDAHPEAFALPPSVRVVRVMLPVEERIGNLPAMMWLHMQAQAVSEGQAKLEDVVERAAEIYKLDPQGDLGWVSLDSDHVVMQALRDAKPGQLLGPLQEGDFGYLYWVEAKREARQLTWEQVKDHAADQAVAYCKQQAMEQVRETLFAKYGVQINQDAIRGLFRAQKGHTDAPASPDGAR